MFELQVRGAAELRRAAAQLRVEDKALRRGAAKALERGARSLRTTIPAAALKLLPSGYGQVMADDVRVTTSVKLASRDPAVTVKVWAEGGAHPEHRDVSAVDAGTLRHPLFGRRRLAWYAQKVPAGFASGPFAALKPAMLQEIEKDWDEMVRRAERG